MPLGALSALRSLLHPQCSAGTFPSRHSQVHTLAHGGCIRRSEPIYRHHDEAQCALLIRSCRWSWCATFPCHPMPCSVYHHESLNFVLFESAQLVEEVGKCALLPKVQDSKQTSPPGLCRFFRQRLVKSSADFHELSKSFKVRPSARHLADRCLVLFHSCIPRLISFPCIQFS
jgi:hypothetical protein